MNRINRLETDLDGTRPLDFLVVGAQKSGTTALWEYLRGHPRIFLPASKEAPFFNNDSYYGEGYRSFAKDYFAKAEKSSLWGVVSPQYMSNREITKRVALTLPSARIVAVLRDPVSRAISHFKMARRRGQETRSIDQAFMDGLAVERLHEARDLPASPGSESRCYLAWGEYGRILGHYLDEYGADRILILFFEDLVKKPGDSVDRLMSFLGLPTGYRPENLGEQIFAGTTESRFPGIKEGFHRSVLGRMWKHLPRETRARLSFTFERINSAPLKEYEREAATPSDSTIGALGEFFLPDVALLEKSFGVSAPWPRFGELRARLKDQPATEIRRSA